jgi:hypothetical protein
MAKADSSENRAAREHKRMPQQPELISPSLSATPALEPDQELVAGKSPVPEAGSLADKQKHEPERIPHWLERAELFLRVLMRMYLGIALCYVPWSRMFWDQNPLFMEFQTLSIYAANGAVRGIVSGLGLLNLWIAFQEAVRHGTEEK